MFHDPVSHVAKFEGMGHHDVTVLEESRTDDEVTVDIEVNVPLAGGKLASFSKGVDENQLTQEFALGDAWLESQ